ncbi:MAG: hypothetical protein PVJ76_06740 [Gemmatimonadota bacterium]|jgi:hypothetical protein
MRDRQRILGNLEDLYREAFARAEKTGDEESKARLDFEFQRDQLYLEVGLDLRELLSAMESGKDEEGKTTSLLEKAQAIRRLTRLR